MHIGKGRAMNRRAICDGWFRWALVATVLILVLLMSSVPLFVTSSLLEFNLQSGRYRRTDFVCGVRSHQQMTNSVLTGLLCNYIANGENKGRWVPIMKGGYAIPHDVVGLPYYLTYRFGRIPMAIDWLAAFWNEHAISVATQKEQAREFMERLNQGQGDRDAVAFVLRICGTDGKEVTRESEGNERQ